MAKRRALQLETEVCLPSISNNLKQLRSPGVYKSTTRALHLSVIIKFENHRSQDLKIVQGLEILRQPDAKKIYCTGNAS